MRILFIGGTYEPNELNKLMKKGHVVNDIAACTFQWKFVEGLYEHQQEIILINEQRVKNYPENKKIFYKEVHKNYRQCECYNYFFINLPIIKKISKFLGIVKVLKKCKIKEDDVILIYSCHTPYLLGACLGKRTKNVKKYLILPDLPQYMNSTMGRIKRVLKEIDYKIQSCFLKQIDGFSLITEHMIEKMPLKADKFVVIEGMAYEAIGNVKKEKNEKPYILYAGTIDARYGIKNLIKAFEKVEFNGNLVFCGDGPDVDLVRNAGKMDKRVIYGGLVDKATLSELQKNAMILVNPRSKNDEYTRYSFPSKTIEYMMSGTPIVMEPLPGIPQEYYQYMFCVENSTCKAWRELLQKTVLLDEKTLCEKGEIAREFVVYEKNAYKQTKKLLELMEK